VLNDAMMLIAVGQTVATEFATIAAANHYGRSEVCDGWILSGGLWFSQLEALSTLQRTCQIIYCNMVEKLLKFRINCG